jgi:hypothetical protein
VVPSIGQAAERIFGVNAARRFGTPSYATGALAALICFLVAGTLLVRMYDVCVSRGMDGTLGEAGNQINSIAVAVSEMVFGLDQGYVGYEAVRIALKRNGMTADPAQAAAFGTRFPDNLRDRALLNDAITAAMQVPVPKYGNFADRSYFSMKEADLGLVDFTKLAFHVFGFRIEALFYLYFLMLGLSAATFIAGHYRSPAALTLPIAFLAAGNLVAGMDVFESVHLQTVTNGRFLATLGLLPAFHLIVLMLERRRTDWLQRLLAALQIAIVAFAYSARSSLIWLVLFFAAFAAAQILGNWQEWRAQEAWSPSNTRRSAMATSWPALLLIAGVFGYGATISLTMHPTFSSDEFLPYHQRWNDGFEGLAAHPDFFNKFAPGNQTRNLTDVNLDEIAFRVGMDYYAASNNLPRGAHYYSAAGDYKYRLHDEVMKHVYFAALWSEPRFFIEAHVRKVSLLFERLWSYTETAFSWKPDQILAMALSIAGLVSLLILARGSERAQFARRQRQHCAATGMMLGFSWIPLLYFVPVVHLLGESLWILTMLIVIMACAIAVGFGRIIAAASGDVRKSVIGSMVLIAIFFFARYWITDQAPVATAAQVPQFIELNQASNPTWSSENFANLKWRRDNASILTNVEKSADKLVESTGTGLHRIEAVVTGLTANAVHTVSLHVKPQQRSGVMFEVRDNFGGHYGVVHFDLARNEVSQQSDTIADAGMLAIGDGWYRCWATMVLATDRAVIDFTLLADDGARSYRGDGNSGLLIWGVQLEPKDSIGKFAVTGKGPAMDSPW